MSANVSETEHGLMFLGSPQFDILHSVALGSIALGFICAITVIVLAFRSQSYKCFFEDWSRGQRFCVYSALCDALFNTCHFVDHAIVLMTQKHPRPTGLCSALGFMTIAPITAKYLMVLMIALHTFAAIVVEKHLGLGSLDWKFLLPCCGIPTFVCVVLGILGYLGPAGYGCFIMDPVVTTYVSSIPQISIVAAIILLYLSTWINIVRKKRVFLHSNMWDQQRQQLISTAQRMTIAVCIFVLQFSPGVVFIILQAYADAPYWFFIVSVAVINVGGVYDGIVYSILGRKKDRSVSTKSLPSTLACKSESSKAEEETLEDIYCIKRKLSY